MFTRKRLLLAALMAILATAAGLFWFLRSELARGKELLSRGEPAAARTALSRYLWLFPGDDDAALALAEAWARDNALPARQSAAEAIALLDRIGDDSPRAGTARQGRCRTRKRSRPDCSRAEKDLRASLQRNPDSFEANYMLWKVLDLTRRYHLVEPFFTRSFRSADPERYEQLLREWYLSQFSTFTASSQLDQMMGFAQPGEPSDAITEYKRLLTFEKSEPDCALNKAVLADWSHQYHVKDEQWKWFEGAWKLVDEQTPPFVFAVLFDLLMEEGRLDEAADVMKAWPKPTTGYDFSKRQGIYHAEITGDIDAAIAACRAATQEWPGPVDWQLYHRLAGLLVRAGRLDAAAQARAEAKRLEKLMEVDFHTKLRSALMEEPSRENYLRMSRFYAEIGRQMEADAWKDLAGQAGRTGSFRRGVLTYSDKSERPPFSPNNAQNKVRLAPDRGLQQGF